MSLAHKINNIRQAEWKINELFDLHESTQRSLNRQMLEAEQNAVRRAESMARSLANTARYNMEAKLNRELSGVDSKIRDLDKQHRERLKQTADEMGRRIDHQASQLREETRRGIDRLSSELKEEQRQTDRRFRETNARIDAVDSASKARYEKVQGRVNALEREMADKFMQQQAQLDAHQHQLDAHGGRLDEHGRRLDSLTVQVNGILARIADEHDRRREAVSMASTLYQATLQRTDLERWVPDEAHRLQDRMARLMSDPDSYSTIPQATEAVMQIQWAEEEAIKRSMVYDALRMAAIEQAEAVLEEARSNRTVSVANPEDPADSITIETDFWMRGEYMAEMNRMSQLRAELDTEPDAERIKAIVADLADSQLKAQRMVLLASGRALLSENRVTVTETIVTSLLEQGWQVDETPDGMPDVGYEGGEIDHDWREGVYAYLHNMRGERMVIRVTPKGDELGNQLQFHRVDNRAITAAEYIRSLNTMRAQIRRSGMQLGDLRSPGTNGGDIQYREVSSSEQLGRAGAVQSLQRQLNGGR